MVVVSNNFDAPVDGVLLEASGTKLIVNDEEWGTATLYITQNNVVWGGGLTPSGTMAATVSLLYPTISLHGIQRHPSPAALYLQLSYDISQHTQTGDEEDFEEGDKDPVSELRFIPENDGNLEAMFNALTTGQSLHPDPSEDLQDDFMDDFTDGEEDNDEDDEAFEDAEESNGTAEQAASRLSHMRLDNSNNGTTHGNGEVQ